MTYTKEQLIEALYREYEYLCHDDFDPYEDPTPEEYREMLKELNYDQLIDEISLDGDSLEDYMEAYG